jgi:hypothetical protein
VRKGLKWRVEGETCSRYFCKLEKRNFVEKAIPNLTLDDGRVIEDIKLILSEQKEYYIPFRYHYSHLTHLVVFPNRIQICFFPYFYMMNMK